MEKLNFNDAVEQAKIIVQNASPKFTFIIDRIVSKKLLDYLILIHAYFRWVDDFVDEPNNPLSEKRVFIDRQKKLVNSIKNNSKINPVANEEYFLYYFVEFALRENLKNLIESAFLMMDVIDMDVMRLERDGVFTQEQLDEYIRMQLKSTHIVLFFFIYNINFNSSEYESFEINNANIKMLMLRDLKEDIDAGLINISREDIKKYKLNIHNLKEDKNLSLWIKDQIDLAINTLYSEISKTKILPIKIKMLYLFFSTYYLPKIIRYKFYGYCVGSFEQKRLIKEICTHWFSLWINIKLVTKIYIK